MDNKRIIKNIGVSIVMKPVSMLLSFVYIPLALAFLGQEKYGIWAIILNIISWINYFDIGIGNGLRNKLAEAVAKNEKGQAKIYVSTAYAGTAVISAVFCIIIIVIWNVFKLSNLFNLTLVDENTDVIIFISVIFVCVNFVLALSKTSAYAIQQPGIISVTGVVGQVAQIIVIYCISHIMKENLLAIALMYGIVGLLDNFLVFFFITRKRKYLIPSIADVDVKYMKPLFTLGIGFFVLQICSLVLNTTDNLLISSLYGSADVTPYNMVYKFFYIAVQVHAIVIMPMWSAYTEAAIKRDITWIKNTMKRINILTAFISIGVIAGIFVFEPLAAVWLQQKLIYGKTLIIIVAIYMIIQMVSNNYSSFLCGVGHIKISTIISAIGALINIPLSFLFAWKYNMGLSGIILGSLSVMMVNVIILPVVSIKWIKQKEREWMDCNERFI